MEITGKQIIRNIKLHLLGDLELDKKQSLIFNTLEREFSNVNKYISYNKDDKHMSFYSKTNGGHYIMINSSTKALYFNKVVLEDIKNECDLNNTDVVFIIQWYLNFKFNIVYELDYIKIRTQSYLNNSQYRKLFDIGKFKKVK